MHQAAVIRNHTGSACQYLLHVLLCICTIKCSELPILALLCIDHNILTEQATQPLLCLRNEICRYILDFVTVRLACSSWSQCRANSCTC